MNIVRILMMALSLWLCMIVPLALIIALFANLPIITTLVKSLFFIPLPVVLLLSVFRTKSKQYRWWVFQYLGVSTIALSASVLGVVSSVVLPSVAAGVLSMSLLLAFCLWSIRAANTVHTKNIQISSPNIKKPLRAVQISDVHVGSRSAAFLEKVVKQVNSLNPDLVLITGDLLDENIALDDLLSLKTIAVPVYYCSGNHERYVDYKRMLSFIEQSGVNVLTDSSSRLTNDATAAALLDTYGINVIGVQDRESVKESADMLTKSMEACTSLAPSAFNLLLYHQPNLWHRAKQLGVELVLSGHTHNGQIWPFGLIVRLRYPEVAGHYQEQNLHLYVSPGTGTWGPIMRFFTRCEMTQIELSPSQD